MSALTVPLDTLVPISRFGRGTASQEFAKVADGIPVTVLRNSEPAYVIVTPNDYRELRECQARLADIEARDQALRHDGESFDSVDELMADLHA